MSVADFPSTTPTRLSLDHGDELVAGHPARLGSAELTNEGDQPDVVAELHGEVGSFDHCASPLTEENSTDDRAHLLTKVAAVRDEYTPAPESHVVPDIDAKALEAVEAIFAGLRDRSFLKWLFDRYGDENLIGRFDNGEELRGIDLEAQGQIKAAWQVIIAKALATTEGRS